MKTEGKSGRGHVVVKASSYVSGIPNEEKKKGIVSSENTRKVDNDIKVVVTKVP